MSDEQDEQIDWPKVGRRLVLIAAIMIIGLVVFLWWLHGALSAYVGR